MSSKIKNNIFDNILIVVLSLIIVVVFLIIYFLNNPKKTSLPKKANTSVKVSTNIEDLLNNIEENNNIVSKNTFGEKYISYLIFEDNIYSSRIVDSLNGNELIIDDLIKEESINDFYDKLFELIDLKYPKFISSILKEKINLNAAFEIKNNELVIYYSGLTFDPIYNETISIKVNYNEIKDYLNFEYVLDDDYTNEDGSIIDESKPIISLTFDDGPNGDNTKKIMQALEDNKMSATFFMAGNKMNNQADVVKLVDSSKNEVGSHTYSHINMKKVTPEEVKLELSKTNNIFKSITGHSLYLVRPPYGAYTYSLISNFPYAFILWSVDTNDWRYKDVSYLVTYILDNAKDGNIILMHDSYKTSVEAVEKVLPILYTKGIQVVNVSSLAKYKGCTLEKGRSYGSLKNC